MEAAREGTPQNVSFDTPFQTGERELSVKTNFIEQDENAMNPKGTIPGTDVCSEEGTKKGIDARNEDQNFQADGTQGVQGCVRLTDKMSQLRSLQLPRGGVPTKALT